MADLFDTMRHAHGIGLAAQQIGQAFQVAVIDITGIKERPSKMWIKGKPVDPEEHMPVVLINPVLTPLGQEMEEGWEGCLSVPGMRGSVPRYKRLRYSGYDEKGQRFEREIADFHARVVQHEVDHLDGILYPMRIRDLAKFGFNEALFPGQELPQED